MDQPAGFCQRCDILAQECGGAVQIDQLNQ